MQTIVQRVAAVRNRQQWQWAWQCAAWGLVAGGTLAAAAVVLILTGAIADFGWPVFALLLAAGPLLGVAVAFVRRRPLHGAAVEIDRVLGLKDRATTAWSFLARPELTPLQNLALADAESHLATVDAARVVPYRAPRPFGAGLVLAALAVLLMLFVPAPRQAATAAEFNSVVADQAARAEAELKQLQEFNKDAQDPEVDKLLKELAARVEELKQPGVDPKEALARLSEMEALLQSRQQQLSAPQTEAQLKSVGEALSLSDEMLAAGQALAKGELDKAADELEKLDLPKLDRQTERAVTEKLDTLRQDSADGMQKPLQEALGKVGEGLGQGNKSRFQDGMKGLAGESRRQSRRSKLMDLLRKQCQCLSECKGECESECRTSSLSKNKGGTQAGLAASGNEPGDKTGLLKSRKDMQLTGQESAQGDVDTETTSAPEQQQAAAREYRDKLAKYKQLSESVLDAESIPLGHRQNIRRYFEMIRPQGTAPAESAK